MEKNQKEKEINYLRKNHSEISGIVKILISYLTNWQSLHGALRWIFVKADLQRVKRPFGRWLVCMGSRLETEKALA